MERQAKQLLSKQISVPASSDSQSSSSAVLLSHLVQPEMNVVPEMTVVQEMPVIPVSQATPDKLRENAITGTYSAMLKTGHTKSAKRQNPGAQAV